MPRSYKRDWAAIARAYARDMLSVAEICERHGITPAALYRRIRKEAWPRRRQRRRLPTTPAGRREDMHDRLYHALRQQMQEIENQMDRAAEADEPLSTPERERHLPAVVPEARARAIAEVLLHDAWAARERARFALAPSEVALDPGDVIRLTGPRVETWRLSEVTDGAHREVQAARVEADLYGAAAFPARRGGAVSVPALGPPAAVFLDCALLRDGDAGHAGYIGAFMAPWPGGVAFYRAPGADSFVLDSVLPAPATLGVTAFDFFAGPVWRWDRGNELWVDVADGQFASATELEVLDGVNAVAVENGDGE